MIIKNVSLEKQSRKGVENKNMHKNSNKQKVTVSMRVIALTTSITTFNVNDHTLMRRDGCLQEVEFKTR